MRRLDIAVAVGFVSIVQAAAAAEASRIELFGGYSYLRQVGEDDAKSFNGWNGALAWNWSERFSVVLDASGHYKSSQNTSDSQTALCLGPAFTVNRGGKPGVFIHALFGIVRPSQSLGIGPIQISETLKDRFGMQFGGGLDFPWGESRAIRIPQVDYRISREGGTTEKDVRLAAGVVLRFGKK